MQRTAVVAVWLCVWSIAVVCAALATSNPMERLFVSLGGAVLCFAQTAIGIAWARQRPSADQAYVLLAPPAYAGQDSFPHKNSV
jgi:hypothetical protein